MKLPKDACVRVFVDLSNKQVWWLGGGYLLGTN